MTSPTPHYLEPDPAAIAAREGYNQAETALLLEFAERGYVVIDLDLPKFDELARRITTELQPHFKAGGRIQDAWRQYDSVRSLAINAQVLRTLGLLYGREAFPFQTLNFNKGTEQATHSDTIHFDCFPRGFMAGVWVALEDIDSGNGPLHYFPGSHKLPQLQMSDLGARGSDGAGDSYNRVYEPGIAKLVEDKGLKREEASLRRGQALIWSANLLHGGSPIREAGRSRHSQVTHYYFDQCMYLTPLLSDPLIGRVFLRQPTDLRTRRPVESWYLGKPVQLPLRRRLSEWRERAFGKMRSY